MYILWIGVINFVIIKFLYLGNNMFKGKGEIVGVVENVFVVLGFF